MINYVNLRDLIKLVNNKELSEKYVNYLCNFDESHQYRHGEIEAIFDLINLDEAKDILFNSFLYSYSIPQLNKEFDLLAFSDEFIVNLEIKSQITDIEKVKYQLISNRHYLSLVSSNLFLFVYIKNNKKIYLLNENGELLEVNTDDFFDKVKDVNFKCINLDEVFLPQNILVSPLNSPDKFLSNQYLLTENQLNIKKEIISFVNNTSSDAFYGLTGSAGTGKTLLLYDIVKTLSSTLKIIVVHSGMLCSGHTQLESEIKNISIIPAKDLRYRGIKDVDLIVVDESHRLYESILDKIERWILNARKKCIFAYDEKQKMSNSKIEEKL